MKKAKAKPKPAAKTNESTHMAKVSLAELGKYWAEGFDLQGAALGEVVTYFDEKSRTAFIEYVISQPAGPGAVQKVTANRRKRKSN
jgi:hypothetical protein